MIDRRPLIAFCSLCLASLCWETLRAATAEKGDPASLSALQDIVVPEPIAPWWPLAPGWYLLAVLVALVAGWVLWRMRQRRLARRYRAEALAELRALRRDPPDPGKAVAAILVLLKRTALGAYPRIDVAGLNGAAWWRFLDLSGGKTRFADGLGDFAERLAYAQRGVDETSRRDLKRLYRAAEHWIRRHRSSSHPSVSVVTADNATGTEV